jgi:hypothetical protein
MIKIVGPASMDIGGRITLKIEEDGKQKEICFSCIRCGISWPISDYPGYYCILGLLNEAKPGESGSLLFLREGENDLLGDLTEGVIQEARGLRFSEIFTDRVSPEWQGMSVSFINSIRKNYNLQYLRLRHIPFADDFHLGRDLIRKWGKNGALKIPEDSILYQHMINPSPERIPESTKHSLYPINALRYVAMAFEKIPFRSHQESRSNVSNLGWI